ncbi:Arc family DNA-binding protein [Ensifer sp. ENS04]|uniref:Arc family DNA-binding protein n=1 Tax=Ensifer sp. ENS04 TaxID=2769281 RepID=UPI00177B5B26|nr:Arc family DNA-binding protein [Ensifer sp. ENS04]MBD9540149.1 Arc family DNA-binding protein [Ensifer sp. ENS04]
MSYVGRGAEQYMLRMPKGMRDEIAAAATANGRSMNSEIIARLMGGDAETLRDKFAGQAMFGALAGEPGSHLTPERLAKDSYEFADAMLAARKAGA